MASLAKLSSNSKCENNFTCMLTKLSKLSVLTKDIKPTEDLYKDLGLDNKKLSEFCENVTLTEKNIIFYVIFYVCSNKI